MHTYALKLQITFRLYSLNVMTLSKYANMSRLWLHLFLQVFTKVPTSHPVSTLTIQPHVSSVIN